MNVLIDGDVVLYEISIAVETPVHWGDDMWTLHADMREASQRFDCWIKEIRGRLSGTRCLIAFSGSDNWRKDVLPTYKEHRKSKRKPLIFHQLKQYAVDIHKTFTYSNLEGDDVLGMMMGDPELKGDKVCVTIDKDLKTVPGLHFNPMRRDDGIIEVTEEDADYNHLLQSLTGDAVDGYSGCPGIGIKRATRILDEDASWDSVISTYNKAGLTEEDALVQARVARILRHGEYNKKKKEVRLWNP